MKIALVASTMAFAPMALSLGQDLQEINAMQDVDTFEYVEGVVTMKMDYIGDLSFNNTKVASGGVTLQQPLDQTVNATFAQQSKAVMVATVNLEGADTIKRGDVIRITNVYRDGRFLRANATTAEVSVQRTCTQESVVLFDTLDDEYTLCEEVDVVRLQIPRPASSPDTSNMLHTFNQSMTVTDVYGFGKYGDFGLTSEENILLAGTEYMTPGDEAYNVDGDRSTMINLNDQTKQYAAGETSKFGMDQQGEVLYSGVKIPGELFNGVPFIATSSDLITDQANMAYLRTQFQEELDLSRPTKVEVTTENKVDDFELRVATFNVLNYFIKDCDRCRGARDEDELKKQEVKLFNTIAQMDAAVYGLQELDNIHPEALKVFTDSLNEFLKVNDYNATYAYVETGVIGTGEFDVIRTAMIYQPALVQPVGAFKLLELQVVAADHRAPLAQTFKAVATSGEERRFTVVNNHFKSKGIYDDCKPICSASPLPEQLTDVEKYCLAWACDQRDGQSNYSASRLEAAKQVLAWIAKDPTGQQSGFGDNYMIIGDLNSYSKETSVTELEKKFTNVVQRDHPGHLSKSYRGKHGNLDHILVSNNLASSCGAAAEGLATESWPVNSFETKGMLYSERLYNPSDVYGSSDHNPMVTTCKFLKAEPLEPEETPNKIPGIIASVVVAIMALSVLAIQLQKQKQQGTADKRHGRDPVESYNPEFSSV